MDLLGVATLLLLTMPSWTRSCCSCSGKSSVEAPSRLRPCGLFNIADFENKSYRLHVHVHQKNPAQSQKVQSDISRRKPRTLDVRYHHLPTDYFPRQKVMYMLRSLTSTPVLKRFQCSQTRPINDVREWALTTCSNCRPVAGRARCN